VAALLVSVSLPFWAAATTGRFYAPFLLASVLVVAVFARAMRESGPDAAVATGLLLALFGLGFVARLIHELAFTLLAIPIAALLFHPPSLHLRRLWPPGRLRHLWPLRQLRPLGGPSAALIAGLVLAQALLMALHFVRPEGGGTMIERFFFWQVLNLFERPHGLPFGLIAAAVLVSWLLSPERARPASMLGAAAALLVLLAGWVSEAIALPLSAALLRDMAAAGLAYPLDMFWYLANTRPMMVWSALALLVARLCGAGGSWPPRERAAHLAWVGWVLWFGVIDSGITINYVLLPTACLLAGIGIDLVALGQQGAALWPGPRAHAVRAALTGAALLVAAEQWAGTGSMVERLAAARPTIHVEGVDRIRAMLEPADLVACTDELACALMVERVDRWLALDNFVRERFLVRRGPDLVGVYAGAPAVFRPADLLRGLQRAAPHRIIIVDVFKEYPVGNSRTWLPRALANDRAEYRELLLTSQARVVELRAAGSGAESHR
jgi:hypothetical protein